MLSNPEQLKKLLETINYPHLLEFIETCWYIDDDIHWNGDNNVTDLYYGDGETYSGELPDGTAEWLGYTVANYDNGCGIVVTGLFNNKYKVSLAELEMVYGDNC